MHSHSDPLYLAVRLEVVVAVRVTAAALQATGIRQQHKVNEFVERGETGRVAALTILPSQQASPPGGSPLAAARISSVGAWVGAAH